MERRPFGATGRQVAVIGQGTWKLRDHARATAALERGIQRGMDHIDTAELYTGSERAIAPVLPGRRDDVWLVSKVLPRHATLQGTRQACRGSLARLGTSYLDVYLLHWPGPHPIEDTMAAMARLVEDGLVRHVGVSNFDVAGMEQARDALGGIPLACNQVLYHPGRRDVEVELLPWCRRHRVALVGYSPLGSGALPGGRDAAARLERIGTAWGKSAHQVVLDALSRHDGVFLIPKAESIGHVEDNARAVDVRMDREALEAFDALYPVPDAVQGVPTL